MQKLPACEELQKQINRLKNKLRESDTKHIQNTCSTLNQMNHPACIVVDDHTIFCCNLLFANLFNKTKPELAGENIAVIASGFNAEINLTEYINQLFKAPDCIPKQPVYSFAAKNNKKFNIHFSFQQTYYNEQKFLLIVFKPRLQFQEAQAYPKTWKNIFNSLDDIALIISKDHIIEDINNAGIKLLNTNRDNVLGKKCCEVIHKTDKPEAFCPINKALISQKTETIQKYEERYDRYYSIKCSPIFNEQGEITHFIDIMRDITKIKASEKQLKEQNDKIARQNEEYISLNEEYASQNEELKNLLEELNRSNKKLKDIFESSLTGLFYINTKGEILEANKTILKILGSPSLEATKAINVFEYEPLKRIGYASDLKQCIVEKKPVFGTNKYTSKWNKNIVVRYYFVPIEQNNQVIGALANIEDVTDLSLTQDALKDSELKYRSLFEGSRDGLVLINADGKFIDCNKSYLKMLDYTLDELKEKNFYEITPEKWHEWEKSEIVEKQLLKRGYSDTYEKEYIRKNGTIFPVELTAYRFRNPQTGNMYLWGVARDITYRKKQETALKESKVFLQTIIDNITDTITKVDTKGVISYASPSWFDTAGYKPNQVIGKTIFDYIHPEDKQKIRSAFKMVLKNKLEDIEYRFRNKKGEYIWCEARGNPIYDDTNKAIGAVLGATVIHNKKIIELRLKQSEAKLKAILNSSMQTFVLLDKNRKILAFNKIIKGITQQLFHKEISEGALMDEFILPGDREDFKADFARALDGKPVNAERKFSIKNKEYNYSTYYNPVYDAEGNIYAVSMNSLDITQQKKAQKARLESETRFKVMVQNVSDIFMILNKNGTPTYISPAMEDMTGYSIEELQIPFIQQLHPGDTEKLLDFIQNVINTPQKNHRFEYRQILKNGGYKTFEAAGQDFTDNPYINGIVLTIRDVTERRQYENQLKKAKEQAEESDRLKTAFLQNISHEIRTPMNGIIGFCEMLNEDNITTELRKKYTDIITENTHQLLHIVSDIIRIAAIETKQENLYFSKIHLNSLLSDLYSQFLPEAQTSGLEFKITEQLPDKYDYIETDEIKLKQILYNLLNNAFKFTHKGYIAIACRVKARFIEFQVKDTGIGIPKSMHKKIFNRFSRVESASYTNYRGTGLGLSIAKAYIELLGGKIKVESELNQGAVFTFLIEYKPVKTTAITEENQ